MLIDTMYSKTKSDKKFLAQATLKALESDDPKARINPNSAVGSVLVKDGVVIASEANRIPTVLRPKFMDLDINSPDRYTVIEHSERNTIYAAWRDGLDPSEGTLYCTRFPCSDCARAIILSNIARLVVPSGTFEKGPWLVSQKKALRIMRLSGVTVRFLNL